MKLLDGKGGDSRSCKILSFQQICDIKDVLKSTIYDWSRSNVMESSMTLSKWLGWKKRKSSPYSEFETIDVHEVCEPSSEIKEDISQLFLAMRFDPEYLGRLTKELNWQNVNQIIQQGVPLQEKIKRGEFGEMLACAMLEQFHGYIIPVPKLRFKQIANETLHGTDTLALMVDDNGVISEVCYVESKLRNDSRNRMVAVEGCEQLKNDYENKQPPILRFVSQRLFEQRGQSSNKQALLDAFFRYMRD